MKQNSVTQFIQLLKCWLCDVWSDFVLKKDWFLSVDQSWLQSLPFSVHLIDLLSIILSCNSFTGIHHSGSAGSNNQTGVQVWLREVLWNFFSAPHWAGCFWLLYTIHFSLHFTIWLRSGSLLQRIREDSILKQWFCFVLFFGQLTRQPLIELFHLSNLFQMPTDYRRADTDFCNFSCSCQRSASMNLSMNRCQLPMANHYTSHLQVSHLLFKTSWTTTALYIH